MRERPKIIGYRWKFVPVGKHGTRCWCCFSVWNTGRVSKRPIIICWELPRGMERLRKRRLQMVTQRARSAARRATLKKLAIDV